MTNYYTTINPSYKYHNGKVSVFTHIKGSITVEASLAVPIFFFAVLCLLCMFEIMAVEIAVRGGLQYAGRIVSQESYPLPVIHPAKIEEYVVESIGTDRMERSLIEGGSTGIDCKESYMSVRTGIGQLTACYKVKIPVPGFFIDGIEKEQTLRIKAWTGYEKEFPGSFRETIVYVTESGMVYHKDYHCTYLDLSIQSISRSSIDERRNNEGGKYYACWICGGGNSPNVYITGSGTKYHGSLSCSGLKRTVYAVPVSEVVGKGACVRCGR